MFKFIGEQNMYKAENVSSYKAKLLSCKCCRGNSANGGRLQRKVKYFLFCYAISQEVFTISYLKFSQSYAKHYADYAEKPYLRSSAIHLRFSARVKLTSSKLPEQ